MGPVLMLPAVRVSAPRSQPLDVALASSIVEVTPLELILRKQREDSADGEWLRRIVNVKIKLQRHLHTN